MSPSHKSSLFFMAHLLLFSLLFALSSNQSVTAAVLNAAAAAVGEQGPIYQVISRPAATNAADDSNLLHLRSASSSDHRHQRNRQRNRQRRRNQQEDSSYPSFDGDLDAILQLALDKVTKEQQQIQQDGTQNSTDLNSNPIGANDVGSGTSSLRKSSSPSVSPISVNGGATDADSQGGTGDGTDPDVTGDTVPEVTGDTVPEVTGDTVPEAPAMAPTPTLPSLLNAHECPPSTNNGTAAGGGSMFMTMVSYHYSVESAITARPEEVVGEIEENMQALIAPEILECLNSGAEVKRAQIVAVDSLPKDERDPDVTCQPEKDRTNVCTVWKGQLRIFVSDQAASGHAADVTIGAVQRTMNSEILVEVVESGLIQAKFLGTDMQPDSALNVPSPNQVNQPIAMDLTAVLLVSIGSAAFVVLAASIYYFRRTYSSPHSPRSEYEGAASRMAGSSFSVGPSSSESPSVRATSPFSDMLPDSYRFDGSMSILSGQNGLPAVMEDDDVHSQASSALIMSEAGYSTEAGDADSNMSFDGGHKSLYNKPPEYPSDDERNMSASGMLGAARRYPDQILTMSDDSSFCDSSFEDPVTPHGQTAQKVGRKGYPYGGSALDLGHESDSSNNYFDAVDFDGGNGAGKIQSSGSESNAFDNGNNTLVGMDDSYDDTMLLFLDGAEHGHGHHHHNSHSQFIEDSINTSTANANGPKIRSFGKEPEPLIVPSPSGPPGIDDSVGGTPPNNPFLNTSVSTPLMSKSGSMDTNQVVFPPSNDDPFFAQTVNTASDDDDDVFTPQVNSAGSSPVDCMSPNGREEDADNDTVNNNHPGGSEVFTPQNNSAGSSPIAAMTPNNGIAGDTDDDSNPAAEPRERLGNDYSPESDLTE